MKLTAFRIENFRSIQDSGWVEIDDLTAIVGKNESGKTSILKALWKFNPFQGAKYAIDREWPRDKRKHKSPDKIVSTLRFQFTSKERSSIAGIHESAAGITGVEIQRAYSGKYLFNFLPQNLLREYSPIHIAQLAASRLSPIAAGRPESFQIAFRLAIDSTVAKIIGKKNSQESIAALEHLRDNPDEIYSDISDEQSSLIRSVVDKLLAEVRVTPFNRIVDAIQKGLPTFIYMDDLRIFRGTAQLDEVKNRKDQQELTAEDETLITIMEMAGLSLDDEFSKSSAQDKEQRILDLDDASSKLTCEIAARWSQKRYEVRFGADGHHFITFVKDVGATALVPLEERSKGFQWFFSFDMMFMHETRGKFANSIILLDEPGLHLHAAAQADLLKRMKAYGVKNQVIYTTHLPFMIDFTRLDNIYVAEDVPNEGTKVHKNWAAADKDSRFTLQAALGLSWSQSLFVGQYNLVVEGVTDFWFLSCVSSIFRAGGETGIDEQLVITPVGGASKAAYVGTILSGQKLNVAVLLDSDAEGKTAYEQLVHQWILEKKCALQIGDIVDAPQGATLEDLFDAKYYLEHVNAVHQKELAGKPLEYSATTKRPIVEIVAQALQLRGVEKFNKGRVAKRIMEDLPNVRLEDLPRDTFEKFKKVIAAVNGIVANWRKELRG